MGVTSGAEAAYLVRSTSIHTPRTPHFSIVRSTGVQPRHSVQFIVFCWVFCLSLDIFSTFWPIYVLSFH
jgi:hypothetical protein